MVVVSVSLMGMSRETDAPILVEEANDPSAPPFPLIFVLVYPARVRHLPLIVISPDRIHSPKPRSQLLSTHLCNALPSIRFQYAGVVIIQCVVRGFLQVLWCVIR